jgi:hypothetical protein
MIKTINHQTIIDTINFSPNIFKWVDLTNFFVIFNKCIVLFRIRHFRNNEIKKFKIKTKNFLLPILNCDLIKKKKLIVVSGKNGNIYLKNTKYSSFFQIFFFNFVLLFIKKNYIQDQILFGIGRTNKKKNLFSNLKRKFCLIILNLEEGKIINIFNFKENDFQENHFYLNAKNKIIIIAHGKNLTLIKFNLNYKTIYLRKIFHPVEILVLEVFSSYLIIADKNEEIFIFKTDCKNLQNKKKKFKFFIQKKINFFFYDRKINFLSFVKKKIFFLNFFYNSLLFSIDLKRKKKKLILVLKKKMHILNLKSKKKTGMLILTNNNILYFFFRKKIFLIFKLPKFNNISFLIKTNSFYQQKQFQSKISPLLFLSKFFFGIAEIYNFLNIYNFRKNIDLKQINLFYNLSKFEGINKFHFESYFNKIGKKFFKIIGLSFFKISLEKFSNTSKNISIVKIAKKKSFKKISNLSLDKKGKKIAFMCLNGKIKIWNSNPFLTINLKKKKKIIYYFRKKISNVCISEDGNIIAITLFKTLIIWKIFPEIQKYKSITFPYVDDICCLNFFYYEKKSFFIINSKKNLSFFDLTKFSIDYDIKIDIFNITIDSLCNRFVLLTSCLLPIESKISYFIVVFKKNYPIPIASINLSKISKSSFISLNFSFFPNKKNLQSFLMIDTFLNFHKIFF